MIEERRKLQVKTLGGSFLEVEVNFSDSEKVNKCQVLKCTYQDKTFDISRDDLVSLLLIVGSADSHQKLLPVKLTNIKKAQRMLAFEWEASKDYKKGEKIVVKAPWIDEIVTEDEVLSGSIAKRKPKILDRISKKLINY